MDTIFQKITEWLKEMLVSGIMESLSGMFDSVNQQVSDVAAQVGTSPVNFSPGVFAMIEALSDVRFARMIQEAEKYLGYPYVWGGSSPSTSFDCSGQLKLLAGSFLLFRQTAVRKGE